MLGKTLSGLLIAVGVVGLSIGDEPKATSKGDGKAAPATIAQSPPTAVTPPEMMPDPTWRPVPGDKVTTYLGESPNVSAVTSRADFHRMAKAFTANDQIGLLEMSKEGSMVMIPTRLRILILQTDIINDWHGLEVRIMEGDHRGKVYWVFQSSVARLIEKPPPYVQPPKPIPKPVEPATRAAALLQAAKNLEKAGNPKAAHDNYRRIVKDFPDTPSAKAASARLKELGVK
jgi:hypothetical protein